MLPYQDLAQEFPEFKDAIHALKMNDAHFRKLFEEYESVAKEVHRDGEKLCDEHNEDLKKRRLELKDDLYRMLKEHSSKTCAKKSCA